MPATVSPAGSLPNSAAVDSKPWWIERRFALLTAGVLGVILYGSLFPFDFHGNTRPLQTVWDIAQIRANRMDILANVLLYWPLGVSAVLALRGWASILRVVLVVLCGAALSVSMEVIQIFEPARSVSVWDVFGNTAGAMLGAATGVVFRSGSNSPWLNSPWLNAMRRRPFVCLMLGTWLGYSLFPILLPTAVAPIAVSPLEWFERCVVWLAVALLIEALVGAARTRPIFVGAAPLIAALFAIHVCIIALRPFQFLPEPRPFGWVPFLSFMMAPRESAVRSFLEKAFTYGTLVWLMVRAGWKLGRTAIAAVALVLALRIVQTDLPGRSAEITDAIMVLGLAGVMKLIEDPSPGDGSTQGEAATSGRSHEAAADAADGD